MLSYIKRMQHDIIHLRTAWQQRMEVCLIRTMCYVFSHTHIYIYIYVYTQYLYIYIHTDLCGMKVALSILFLSPCLAAQIHLCIELLWNVPGCIRLLHRWNIKAAFPLTPFELTAHVFKRLIFHCPCRALALRAFFPATLPDHRFSSQLAQLCAIILGNRPHLNATWKIPVHNLTGITTKFHMMCAGLHARIYCAAMQCTMQLRCAFDTQCGPSIYTQSDPSIPDGHLQTLFIVPLVSDWPCLPLGVWWAIFNCRSLIVISVHIKLPCIQELTCLNYV